MLYHRDTLGRYDDDGTTTFTFVLLLLLLLLWDHFVFIVDFGLDNRPSRDLSIDVPSTRSVPWSQTRGRHELVRRELRLVLGGLPREAFETSPRSIWCVCPLVS